MNNFFKKITILLIACVVSAGQFVVPAQAASTNLLANPSAESLNSAGAPVNWNTGNWGTNNANFSVANTGYDGSHSLVVTICSYSSGDAKWYPDPVAVTAGQNYYFSDYYMSNVATSMVAAYVNATGNVTYGWLGDLPAASSWTLGGFTVTVPQGVQTMTVFHLLANVGTLTTDNFALGPVTASTIANNVPNNSVEQASPVNPNAPQDWLTGNWGTNSTTFSYLNTGHTGTHSLKVQISSYTDGDAKWYFTPQALAPNTTYQFSDYYQSNIQSQVVLMIQKTDGSIVYSRLRNANASPNAWTQYTDVFVTPPDIANLTVLHLINGVGYLTTDDYAITPFTTVGFSRPIVTLTFDDGDQTLYDNALPLLNQYGFTSTDYIISGYLGMPTYLTSSEVKALSTAGMEIGSHTVDHADLSTLSRRRIDTELSNSKKALESIVGVGKVTDFALPYGTYNSTVTTEVMKYYKTMRTTDEGYNAANTTTPQNIRVENMYNTTTLAQFNSWIAQAQKDKTWLVIVYHNIQASPGQYDTSITDFQAQLSSLKSSGVAVETVAQALNEVTPQLVH